MSSVMDARLDSVWTVPFNDLSLQWNEVAEDVRRDFEEVFERSVFCLGPHVELFEAAVARYLGVNHAIALNSGTSALHLAMVACDLSPGDEVLVPAHTFIATLWGPLYAGLAPVLCEVDADTGTIDWADAARRLTPRTRAVIPVHLYGQPADMEAARAFAEAHGLDIIEDAAQAIGARWKGRAVGTIGRFGCFSFYPGKNLGAAGEGGLIVTSEEESAARLRSLRNHAQTERYVHSELGFNYRMDALQAVVLRHKLGRLDAWTARRRRLAERYIEALLDLPLAVPPVRNGDHVWHLFVVRARKRDALRIWLQKAGIEAGLHYPVGNHRQPALQHIRMDRDSFPEADRWARECLSLPLFTGMTDAQQERVIEVVRGFFA